MNSEEQNEKIYKALLKFLGFMALIGGLLLWLSGSAGAVPGYPPARKTIDGLASVTQPLTASGSVIPAIASYSEGDLFITTASPPVLYRLQAGEWAIVGPAASESATDTENAITLQGRDVSASAPADAQVLAWNDALSKWEPQTTTGTTGTDTENAVTLQGRTLSNATPSANQVIGWDATGSEWLPMDQAVSSGTGEATSTTSFDNLVVEGNEVLPEYPNSSVIAAFDGGDAMFATRGGILGAIETGGSGLGAYVKQSNIGCKFKVGGVATITVGYLVEVANSAHACVQLATNSSESVVGVMYGPSDMDWLISEIPVGSECWVLTWGVALIHASGTVETGDLVWAGEDGSIEKAGTISTLNDYRRIVGRVLRGQDENNTGEYVQVLLGK